MSRQMEARIGLMLSLGLDLIVFLDSETVRFFNYFFFIRPRFGLFSQPVSTAVGDTNKYKKVIPKRDDDGKVATAPKNFYTGPMKMGKSEDVYFEKADYLCRGDPFRMAAIQSMRSTTKDGHLKAGHDRMFRPAKNPNEKIHKALFDYKEEGPHQKDPKDFRDPDGGVITAPTNFYTNPMKKGKVG